MVTYSNFPHMFGFRNLHSVCLCVLSNFLKNYLFNWWPWFYCHEKISLSGLSSNQTITHRLFVSPKVTYCLNMLCGTVKCVSQYNTHTNLQSNVMPWLYSYEHQVKLQIFIVVIRKTSYMWHNHRCDTT